jgi:transcriptional repressor NrdR
VRCPLCLTDDTRVVDSRPADSGTAIRRRRECAACGYRFTTYERLAMTVRKRDGRSEAFDPRKVRRGIERALADRAVPSGTIDAIVNRAEGLFSAGTGTVTASDIGDVVLAGLREVDEVAYLRFASVYKEFQGARDFEREAAALEERT